MSRLFLDHGTRVELSCTTFLVSKCLEIGAEVSHNVLMRKCLVGEVSSNLVHLAIGVGAQSTVGGRHFCRKLYACVGK